MSVAELDGTRHDENDASTITGARALAERINAYWEKRGIKANARPVIAPFHSRMREAYFVVRSDLVNAICARPRREEF